MNRLLLAHRRGRWHPPAQRSRAIAGRAPERGAAGIEVLPLLVLVFVSGSLLMLNLWAVVDTKLAVEAAAREAARAYAEAPDPTTGRTEAERAASSALLGAGRTPAGLTLRIQGERFARCAPFSVLVTYEVPAIRLPFLGDAGASTVRGRHQELIDPYASGGSGEAVCAP